LDDTVRDLEKIWILEEIKARQRSRDKNIREDDRNTTYFQAISNQRARKKRIPALETPDGLLEDTKDMLNHTVDFYKHLFGAEENLGVHLGENFWEEGDKVTDSENELLEAPFTEEEIKNTVFDSYAEGGPGPDGFSFLFYQSFWDVIKSDFINLVKDFEADQLNLDRLNYAIITLIPKEAEAKHLKKFRPISLINCSFKVFAKALNKRLIKLADILICPNQTTFIKGRFILESVVAAHEIIHDIHRNKESGIILKLDYEKAYDRVSWDFIEEMLISRGFRAKRRSWMKRVIQGGSICVRINNENSIYFKPGKGLRQGDPLSPIMFNLVADIFTRMLMKAARINLVSGLLPRVAEGVLSVCSMQMTPSSFRRMI